MKKGFTLIELLIVIAVLGILAAALLATVDPLEQMKKARDTSTRNTVVEIYNAVIRYNANRGSMPWDPNGGVPGACTVAGASLGISEIGRPVILSCLKGLVDNGELKTGFTNSVRSMSNKIWITGDSTTVSVCFAPESKAIKQDQATKFSADLTTGSCSWTLGGTNTCYWCAQ